MNIKVKYGRGGTVTINSPVLFNQNNLQPLTAGTYSGKGTKYYMLTMPSDGNVDFNGNGILLYDTNLNPIKTPATYFNQLKGITPLLAGNYIIKVKYGRGGTVTINSPVLN